MKKAALTLAALPCFAIVLLGSTARGEVPSVPGEGRNLEANDSGSRLGSWEVDSPSRRETPPGQLGAWSVLQAEYTGDQAATRAMAAGLVCPLTLASGDLDEDGIPDLIIGYAGPDGGILAIQRGNADSIYQDSAAAKRHRADGTFISAPFLPEARLVGLPEAPELLTARDLDGDGHSDLLVASRGNRAFSILHGNGHGRLGPAQRGTLPGRVMALLPDDDARGGDPSRPEPIVPGMEPVTTLRMRLNSDALDDLVVLNADSPRPELFLTDSALVFYVNSTADTPDAQLDGICDDGTGHCTLRAAIQEANFNPGPDQIQFYLENTVTVSIAPTTPLPPAGADGNAVTIDGTTQPGHVELPIVQISCAGPPGMNGLTILGGPSVVRGLVVNNCAAGDSEGAGISVSGNGNIIEGNFIGTGFAGITALPNRTGVLLTGATNSTIGGTRTTAGNLISGNFTGIRLTGSSNNVIAGNVIGLQAGGTSPLGNSEEAGILIEQSSTNNTIGGSALGSRNTIAFNARNGIRIESGCTNDSIRRNSIFSNVSTGIALGPGAEPTANDESPSGCPADTDEGPNGLQNYPELTSVISSGGSVTIDGTIASAPHTSFALDFFSNPACDGSGNGEGKTFLGSSPVAVTTGSDCRATFQVTFPRTVSPGESVTATATDPSGNTSEFSPCVTIPIALPSITVSDVSVTEGNVGTASAVLVLSLSELSPQTVTVHYQTSDGTATAGSDYTGSEGTVPFNPGERTQSLVFPVSGDTFMEPDETFFVNLSNPVNAVLGNAQAMGTIRNDDLDTTLEDLAVTRITAPKRVVLRGSSSVLTRVAVQIQNRSAHAETITSAGALAGTVTLSVESLGACPAPTPGFLQTNRDFPFTVRSKQLLTVVFTVLFGCANDPAASTKADPSHFDYRFTAHVDHSGIDGRQDTHTVDDDCPRSVPPPFITDPNPDGKIKDKGCGTRRTNGTFGGEIVTDVVMK